MSTPFPTSAGTICRASSHTLPNGLKYILHYDPSEPIVCLQAVIKSGSANERTPEAGFSHFIEHLAFKSSKHYGFNQIASVITDLGGSLNAYTDFDSTCYYLLLPSEHLQVGLKVLTELVMNARFSADDVKTEKEIIQSEIEQYRDDPETDFLEYIQMRYFRRSPLRKPIAGTVQDIQRVTYTQLKSFYKRRYHPAACFFVASGNAEPKLLHSTLAELTQRWKIPQRAYRGTNSNWIEPEIGRTGLHWQKAPQNLFALVLPELSELHPQSDALLAAIRYLAIGRASKLHKILVEEKKLCSALRVNSLCGVMSGASAIVFITSRTKSIPAIAKIIRQELSKLWHSPISEAECELIRRDIIHSWIYGFEARENIANLLVAEELLGDYNTLYDYDKRINRLTAKLIHTAVRDYWKPENLALFFRGPSLLSLPKELIPGKNKDYILEPKSLRLQNAFTITEAKPDCSTTDSSPTPQSKLIQLDERHYQGQLDNGISFIYKCLSPNPITGIALSSPISQLWENTQQRGSNFFLSTSLLYQSAKMSHQEIMDLSRRLGMNIRVNHNLDTTTYRGKCFAADTQQALGLLAELLSQIHLDKDYFSTLKAAASDAIRREQDNPPGWGYLLWLRMAFGIDSPIQRSTGTLTSIRELGLGDLWDWYDAHYHPANYHLSICSALEPEYAWDLANRCLGEIYPKDNPTQPQEREIKPRGPRSKSTTGDNGQCVIHMGAPATSSLDRISTTASHLLAQIIGGEINSRFFDIIREKYGIAYQVSMEVLTLRQLGYWTAYAFCNHDDKDTCFDLMQDIILDVAHRGVTPQELQKAKNYMKGMQRFDCESVSYQAAALASLSALEYPISHLLERDKRIDSIDLDTINAVAAKWLSNPAYWVHIQQ